MEKFFYEAVLTPNELGGYDATFPDFDIITMGDDLADAAFMAQDLLATWVSASLARGESVPAAGRFGHECPDGGTLMGIATFADAGAMGCDTMTVQEAADTLDVSTARIHAMIRDGILGAEKVGSARLVSAADVMAYFNSPRSAGRPRKAATA